MTSNLSQIFPPAPKFTEDELHDLTGKTALITGGASGIGLELAKILYSKNATVYIAARSIERANAGIEAVRKDHPVSAGNLCPLVIDLGDLTTIKGAAQSFLEREEKLHVLVHNAGVMTPPAGSRSKQNYDLEMATNCLGPFLFNKLLEPIMRGTAKSEPPNTVRQVWVSSSLGLNAPKGGVQFDEVGKPIETLEGMNNYMQSKAGDMFLAAEFAKRLSGSGVLSVSLNPGIINTELQRHMGSIERKVMGCIFKPARYGAYTELYAGFSPEVTLENNGNFFVPWGRQGSLPAHLSKGLKTQAEGGSGVADRFFRWCESETGRYM